MIRFDADYLPSQLSSSHEVGLALFTIEKSVASEQRVFQFPSFDPFRRLRVDEQCLDFVALGSSIPSLRWTNEVECNRKDMGGIATVASTGSGDGYVRRFV